MFQINIETIGISWFLKYINNGKVFLPVLINNGSRFNCEYTKDTKNTIILKDEEILRV